MDSDLNLSGFHEYSLRMPSNDDTNRTRLFAYRLLQWATQRDEDARNKAAREVLVSTGDSDA